MSIGVLVVDDHPVVREGICRMIETAEDIRAVAEAGDGRGAIEKVAECRPQVVLMDVVLPDMTGIEATRHIKKDFPEVSVIMFTGYEAGEYIREAIAAGAGGFLPKAISRDVLLNSIRAAVSGDVLIRSSLFREALRAMRDAEEHSRQQAAQGEIVESLSSQETKVLQLVVEGLTNKEIGDALFLSEHTIKKYVQNIMSKLGASDRTQAAVKGVRLGIVK